MEIKCPKCNKLIDLDNYDLPNRACDDAEIECSNESRQENFMVGWYATAELR